MCYRCLDKEFSVEQSNFYFTVIGSFKPGMQMQEIFVQVNTFYSRSSFLDYEDLRVNG